MILETKNKHKFNRYPVVCAIHPVQNNNNKIKGFQMFEFVCILQFNA